MSTDAGDLCWVLTEAEHPFRITAASDAWYGVWQLAPEDAIGSTTKQLLCGPGHDVVAGRLLMQQFAARNCATQRCTNMRADGTLVTHTVSLMRTQGGLLAVSSDMDVPEDLAARKSDGHSSLLDVSARIAADAHASRERRGLPAVDAVDVAAAALDGKSP